MIRTTTTHHKRRLIPLALASISVAAGLAANDPGGAAHALPGAVAGDTATDGTELNLAGWRSIFRDDFNTNVAKGSFPDAVSGKWGAYPAPWKDTSGHGVYSPKEVVSIANGVLTEDIHTSGGVHKVAALLPKVPGTSSYGQLYGRYEVRMRADMLPGYKMAWMLWPDSGTTITGASGGGGNGEIDYPEGEFSDNTKLWGFVHRQNATTGGDQAWFKIPVNFNGWHTYTLEWSPNLIVLRMDGTEVGRTTERIPNTPMHWVLQTETSLKMTPADSTRGNVQIDYVAAWAYDRTAVATGDTTAPSVTVGGIASGATVAGVVNLTANASDPSGITAVKWYVDGQEVQWDGNGAPWVDAWDSRGFGNGQHSLFAKARDSKGNWGTSDPVAFSIGN